ncbi:MAG: ABC transporter ATP-binding protein/permease [Clostridia bacterium]|nr:ABC transporter ATP-binding protein/permease [Clostridia bacterium]
MLRLYDIVKDYPTATTTVHALKGVNLAFRKSEFVAILGPSGCGKTTMLNIIGGLDRYTSGDLVIGGVSTKDFDDAHWDAYRNATIGFVFQTYNLIPHLTVLENVELALSLCGEKKASRRAKCVAALTRVGMEAEINKRPNQLSGGQMQRVAIARAIVNNPKIILADEPTGALDSDLSVQVMDILKEISNDRLVIMVTHNDELANQYCPRICRFKDGKLISDSNPYDPDKPEEEPKAEVPDKQEESDSSVNHMEEYERAKAIEFGDAELEAYVSEITLENTIDREEPAKEEKTPEQIKIQQKIDDFDYSQMFLDEPNEKKRKQKISNHKRKQKMQQLNADTKAFFEQLGLNQQKKKKFKKDPNFKPTSMSGGLAFGLSLRNLVAKFRRTFLTSFAGSIGIIGLGLVLSISNGFSVYVEDMQTDMLVGIPLGIYEYNIEVTAVTDMVTDMIAKSEVKDPNAYPKGETFSLTSNSGSSMDIINEMMSSFFKSISMNELSSDFDNHMRNLPSEHSKGMTTFYGTRYNIVSKVQDKDGNWYYKDSSQAPKPTTALNIAMTVLGQQGLQSSGWNLMIGDKSTMLEEYDMIGEGSRYPENKNEILLSVNEYNQVDRKMVEMFGIDVYERNEDGSYKYKNGEPVIKELEASTFIGQTLKLVSNDDYYMKDSFGNYLKPSKMDVNGNYWAYDENIFEEETKLEELYNSSNAQTLTVTGIIRPKKHSKAQYVGTALCYTQELADYVVSEAYESEVAKYQRQLDEDLGEGTNTIFGQNFLYNDTVLAGGMSVVEAMGATLEWTSYSKLIGSEKAPTYLSIYPVTYSDKEKIGEYIHSWPGVGYFDVSEMMVYMLNTTIDLVSVMLIAVACISLVVSTVMIGVITANSVIERIREIGILRALGARKADIRNVFVSETTIIGLFSGILGITLTYVFCPIINVIIEAATGVESLLHFNPLHALILVLLSLVLTVLSGVIPAINASRKNVVEALRVE